MVQFTVSNEIFIGAMMFLIIPTVLYLYKIMNKISALVICFQNQKVDYDKHKEHSDVHEDRLNQLSEKSSMHTLLIENMQDDIKELKGKRSPI